MFSMGPRLTEGLGATLLQGALVFLVELHGAPSAKASDSAPSAHETITTPIPGQLPDGGQFHGLTPGERTPRTPRLYELMFTSDDEVDLAPSRLESLLRSNGLLTNDFDVAAHRLRQVSSLCREVGTLIRRYSPSAGEFLEQATQGQLRRRVLVCSMTGSGELPTRTADCDSVGNFVVICEEPHSALDATSVRGQDLDVVKISLLADRLYGDGDLAAGTAPQLVYDIGGYLFANAEYYLNADSQDEVRKADEDAVKQTAHELMVAITDFIKSKENGLEVERVLREKQSYYESLLKQD